MYTIEDLKKFAKNKGGDCLSIEYKTNDTKYIWICEKNHKFECQWMSVNTRGVWCETCRFGHYIEYLQEYAFKHDGTCLSEKFTNSERSTKYHFICKGKKGPHNFDLTYPQIKKNIWCKHCKNGIQQYTIKDLQNHAEKKGGNCLSDKFLMTTTKYIWQCGGTKKHTWFATWSNVYKGDTWCPKCKLWTLEDLEKIAEKKGGKCLKLISGKGIEGIYEWECEFGDTWNTKGSNIVHNNTWCPTCQKLNIKDCHNEAKKREGKCLDNIYINRRTHMNWKCKNIEHPPFSMTMGSIRNGKRWCRECHFDSIRLDLSIAHELAEKNGGKCLSTKYVNLETPMKWMCKKGHKWKVAMLNIKGLGTWCPYCKNKSESLCREIFESIFTPYIFKKKRLKCLEGLELDGYSKELKIAFEYDGIQHIRYTPLFHSNGPDDLYEQMVRDERKDILCVKNDITLIRIPHDYTYMDKEKMEQFIYNELERVELICIL